MGQAVVGHQRRDVGEFGLFRAEELLALDGLEQVRQMALALDAGDAATFAGYFAEDARFRFGNARRRCTNTCEELSWKPSTTMADALRKIFDAYRGQVAAAQALMD